MSQLVRLEGKHTCQNAHCALLSPLSQTYYSEMLKKRQKTRSPPKGRNSRRKTQAKKERAKHLNPFQSIYVFKTESLCKQFNLLVRDIRPPPPPQKKIDLVGVIPKDISSFRVNHSYWPCSVSFIFLTLDLSWNKKQIQRSKWAKQVGLIGQMTRSIYALTHRWY